MSRTPAAQLALIGLMRRPSAGTAAMETDKPAEGEAKAGEGEAKAGEGEKKEAPKVEPSSYSLANPCRVTPGQAKFVAFKADSRWAAGGLKCSVCLGSVSSQ